ncbi:MAG: hypothetical protein ACK5WZ_11480 [Pseudobdellovibrionaceae bacterium]
MKKYVMASMLVLSLIAPALFAAGPAVRGEAYSRAREVAERTADKITKEATASKQEIQVALSTDGGEVLTRLNLTAAEVATLASRVNGGKEYLERILQMGEMAKSETTTAAERANLQIVAKAFGKITQISTSLDAPRMERLKTTTGLSEAMIREIATDIAPKMGKEFIEVYMKRSAEENADLTALYTDVANAPAGGQLAALAIGLKRIAKSKYPNETEEEALRKLIEEIKRCLP